MDIFEKLIKLAKEKTAMENRDIDIEIKFYNTVKESQVKNQLYEGVYGYSSYEHKDVTKYNLKEEIGIFLNAHLMHTNEDISMIVEELNNTVIHELIHALGSYHTEMWIDSIVRDLIELNPENYNSKVKITIDLDKELKESE